MNVQRVIRLLTPLARRRGKLQKWAVLVIALVAAYSLLQPTLRNRLGRPPVSIYSNKAEPGERPLADGEQAILAAFRARRSNINVQCEFKVVKLLRDDNVGDRHQKMILKLPSSGHTILLAHNIDLADRVPAREGDTIQVRGEYEFSEKGGVVHWTHHDPRGHHAGGWVEFDGKRYQ